MTADRRDLFQVFSVPDPCASVFRTGDHIIAVIAEGDVVQPGLMAEQRAYTRADFGAQQYSIGGKQICRCDGPSIRTMRSRIMAEPC